MGLPGTAKVREPSAWVEIDLKAIEHNFNEFLGIKVSLLTNNNPVDIDQYKTDLQHTAPGISITAESGNYTVSAIMFGLLVTIPTNGNFSMDLYCQPALENFLANEQPEYELNMSC